MSTLAMYDPTHDLTRLPDEQQVVIGFLATCRTQATLIAYQQDLKHYFRWLEEHHLSLLHVNSTTINLYMRWMQDARMWAESTIARRIGTVCSLYAYAADEDYIPKDIGRKVKRPTVDHSKQHTPFLLPVEFAILTKHIRLHGSVMEQAYFAMCGLRGMRIGSACSLNVRDYTTHAGYRVLTFVKKGGKLQTLQVPPPVAGPVEDAIGDRGPEEPILLNEWGNRMTRANAALMLRRLCRAAGVSDAMASHGLRRSFTTAGAAAGVPLDALAETLGHANTATTKRHYDKLAGSIFRDRSGEVAAWVSNLAS